MHKKVSDSLTAHYQTQSLSIIIPVLNEAKQMQNQIQTWLLHLRSLPNLEIIVVDGGSQDQTVDLVKAAGIQVIQSLPGRANQLNAGAQRATGEILLFLHADTRLPENFGALIYQTLAKPGTVAGAFELKIDGQRLGLRWVEWGVRWRSRLCQLPYGDQALFLSAATFNRVGGFPELPIMEDFVLVRQLQQLGRVAIAPAAVLTSGRRWQKLGIWRTTFLNQLVILAYYLGVSPHRIADWYRSGAIAHPLMALRALIKTLTC